MKIKLINKPQNLIDIIYTSARTCYNAGSPIDMWEEVKEIPVDKKMKLIKSVIKSGHTSTLEHINFTWCIEGVSRALLAQISRHRHISLSVQSQRYVEIKENIEDIDTLVMHLDAGKETLLNIANKYFVNVNEKNYLVYIRNLLDYLEAIQNGFKPEDARMFLPNATKTNMVITMNLRELIHICNLRLCTRAQAEIRKMIKEMKDSIIKEDRWLEEYLQPSCEKFSFCPESKGCGKKPSLKKILEEEFTQGYSEGLGVR